MTTIPGTQKQSYKRKIFLNIHSNNLVIHQLTQDHTYLTFLPKYLKLQSKGKSIVNELKVYLSYRPYYKVTEYTDEDTYPQ